jgi:hypothetical protein
VNLLTGAARESECIAVLVSLSEQTQLRDSRPHYSDSHLERFAAVFQNGIHGAGYFANVDRVSFFVAKNKEGFD